MLSLRWLWRDWRGGELGILFSALLLAVSIVTGVSSFVDRLQVGIERQSHSFLAADRVLRSSRPINPSWLVKADQLELQRAEIVRFSSMLFASDNPNGALQLVSVKAVSTKYPLKGRLEISEAPFQPGVPTDELPQPGEVWIDGRLMPMLGLELGSRVAVGDADFTVTRILKNEPDRGNSFAGFGLRVLMRLEDLDSTGVVQPGSRVEYRYLFAGAEQQLNRYGEWLKPQLSGGHRWLDIKESQPQIGRALDRAERFLLLVGTLGVVLAGVAISLAARRYCQRHLDHVAVLKSMGVQSTRILLLFASNLFFLGVLATLAGSVVGWGMQDFAVKSAMTMLQVDTPALTWRPFVMGAATCLICLLAFAMPSLIALRTVSPVRVLRRDSGGGVAQGIALYGPGCVGVVGLTFWYSGSLPLTMALLLGSALVVVASLIVAKLLLRSSRNLGMRAGSALRLGISSLSRRAQENALQMVVFSLSIMLFLILSVVRTSLLEEWQAELPEGTPNHFLLNVSPDNVREVGEFLDGEGVARQPLYPIVRARLSKIDGLPLREKLGPELASEGDINRELNLSWSVQLPEANQLVAGEWWGQTAIENPVSVERDFADRFGLQLGMPLEFQAGSQTIRATIASIRTLDWNSMRPNFYMLFPANSLADFPMSFITSFHLSPDQKLILNELLTQFPTLTVIEIDAVIAQIESIIDQVSLAVEVVLALIVLCALLVLVASVRSSLDERLRESAILRTLGGQRPLIMGGLLLEFVVLGAMAGLMAAGTGQLAVRILQSQILEMTPQWHLWLWWVGPLAGACMVGLVGYQSCRRVVDAAPMRVLRELG